MGAISAEDIISIIQSEIENFDVDNTSEETGTVIYVGDGIVTVYGIDHAMYGEVVVFDNGVKGMVQDIRQNEIGVILFGRDTGIKEGTKVVRTKKKAIDKIIDTVMEQNLKSPIKGLIVHHINCESEGQELANKLQDKLGISNIKIQSIGPIIGLHVGPGSIGVAYHY